MSYKWIQASEIADYAYCRRSWWLKRTQGLAPENVRELQLGTRHHQAHGQLVQRAVWTRRLAYGLMFGAVAFVVFQLLTRLL